MKNDFKKDYDKNGFQMHKKCNRKWHKNDDKKYSYLLPDVRV